MKYLISRSAHLDNTFREYVSVVGRCGIFAGAERLVADVDTHLLPFSTR
jgi:hypothetical protein